MKIPIIVVFTKVDLIYEEEIVDCIKLFKHTLKKFNINKNPIIIRNIEDSDLLSRNIYEQIIPIFTVTNLKWDGLNLFKRFPTTGISPKMPSQMGPTIGTFQRRPVIVV